MMLNVGTIIVFWGGRPLSWTGFSKFHFDGESCQPQCKLKSPHIKYVIRLKFIWFGTKQQLHKIAVIHTLLLGFFDIVI